MSTVLIGLSTWLHTLATVVFVGHYVFLTLIYLPVLERRSGCDELRQVLEQVSHRLQPYFGGSLLVFLATGTYLMLINQDYLGLGNFFANTWSILIVAKHVLVLGFLMLAIYSDRAILTKIGDKQPQFLSQFRLALRANTLLGLLILLFTSAAQAAG